MGSTRRSHRDIGGGFVVGILIETDDHGRDRGVHVVNAAGHLVLIPMSSPLKPSQRWATERDLREKAARAAARSPMPPPLVTATPAVTGARATTAPTVERVTPTPMGEESD